MKLEDLFLPAVGAGLVIALAILLVRKGLYRKYPWFFTYVIFSIIASAATFASSGDYQSFFKVYWTTEALHAILALLALYEAFRDVFSIDYEDWPWFRLVFPAAVVILSAIFVGAALIHASVEAPRIIAVILSFGTVVNCIKGGLFVLFAILAFLLLGETWPTYPFGVVAGFAVSAFGSAAAFWARSVFGTRFNSLAKYGPPVAYIFAVSIWIASCFLPREPENRWSGFRNPEAALATVKQYVQVLKRMVGRR
jgi:uncharacterized integral membrane protein